MSRKGELHVLVGEYPLYSKVRSVFTDTVYTVVGYDTRHQRGHDLSYVLKCMNAHGGVVRYSPSNVVKVGEDESVSA